MDFQVRWGGACCGGRLSDGGARWWTVDVSVIQWAARRRVARRWGNWGAVRGGGQRCGGRLGDGGAAAAVSTGWGRGGGL